MSKNKNKRPPPLSESEIKEIYAQRYPNAFSAESRGIKVGDRVRQVGYFAECDRKRGRKNFDGTVSEIYPHNPDNPIEEHGAIIVIFDDGSDGDFVDYSREDLLKKID